MGECGGCNAEYRVDDQDNLRGAAALADGTVIAQGPTQDGKV